MELAEKKRDLRFLDAFTLKCIAMALMLCDHAWATIAPSNWTWLTCVGRLAFPIFAFQVAEGFRHTHDRKKYLKRMFIFALISELPFNLMAEGGLLFPFHQNVMFTFCIAIAAMMAIEWGKTRGKVWYWVILAAAFAVSYLLGFVTFVDYYGCGVATVLIFYLLHGKRFGWIGEILGLWYINWEILGGLVYELTLFGRPFALPEQGLAVLALIPIFLYNGKQGPHSKKIQYACYAFYPAHMLALYLLSVLLYA